MCSGRNRQTDNVTDKREREPTYERQRKGTSEREKEKSLLQKNKQKNKGDVLRQRTGRLKPREGRETRCGTPNTEGEWVKERGLRNTCTERDTTSAAAHTFYRDSPSRAHTKEMERDATSHHRHHPARMRTQRRAAKRPLLHL